MTLVLAVTCAAVARVVFGSRDRLWPALVMPALIVALPLTFTRSAEVGVLLAVGLLLLLKDFRLLALLPVVVALLFAFAPDSVTDRMASMFDMKDPNVRDRVAMLNTGRRYMLQHAQLIVYPGVAIMLTILGINLFGDGLRLALDPRRTRGVLLEL